MATSSMMPAAPQADPAMADPDAGAAPAGADEEGGFEIVIKVAADGSLSVGMENEAQEAPEAPDGAGAPAAEPDDDADFTPAKDIKEALTLALGLYKSGGKSDGREAMGQRLQSAGFQAGYQED